MSASTGSASKGEKGKTKYSTLDINNVYNSSRSESSEAQQTKSTAARRHGMQSLGKVPQRRTPANLPSIRSENSGNDPSVSLVPQGLSGWGVKTGENLGQGSGLTTTQQSVANVNPTTPSTTLTPSAVPAVAAPPAALPPTTQTAPIAAPLPVHVPSSAPSGDKTWSSVMSGGSSNNSGSLNGPDRGPSFLAHQSPQFQQEFPSLSGEPGGVPVLPVSSNYGPGPSLRPQTEGSWTQGGARQPPSQAGQSQIAMSNQYKTVLPDFLLKNGDGKGFPMFPASIQSTRSRTQNSHSDNNRLTSTSSSSSSMLAGRSGGNANAGTGTGGGGSTGNFDTEDLIPRPIIRDEDLHRMDELAHDVSWAANDDIDYNETLAFSDGESVGDDEKDKESKLKEKNKLPVSNKDDKKEIDVDKNCKEKIQTLNERTQPQQLHQWRSASQNFTPADYRNNTSRPVMQNMRVENEDLMWDAKRRVTKQNKQAASEKAKQRKEEEEKRFEESRAKKNLKDNSPDQLASASNVLPEREKEDRLKASENFKQMTQRLSSFQLDSGSTSMRDRDRDMRKDRDNQSYRNYQNQRPTKFHNNPKRMQGGQFGGGGSSGFDNKWNHMPPHFQGRRPQDKDDDFRKERIESNNERYRNNFRDDRNREDLNKKNYFDDHHSDYSGQSSFQLQNKEIDGRDRDSANKENEKDNSPEKEKDWEPPKNDLDSRTFGERHRKDSKSLTENIPKSMDQFDDRPESRDRPSRPDSRDSRTSKDSRNSRDDNRSLPTAVEADYGTWVDNEYDREKIHERRGFKDRRDNVHRIREHVPGPITPEKIEAYEHKQSQNQAEKRDKDVKEMELKIPKPDETDGIMVWQNSTEDKPVIHSLMDSVKPMTELMQGDSLQEDLDKGKDDSDKRRETVRDKGYDKMGRGANRNNRGPRGFGGSLANSSSAYGPSSRNNTWNPRDQRPRRNSPKGKSKHWHPSESDNSADEVSASTESGKDEKKGDRKVPLNLNNTWKSDKSPREEKSRDSKISDGMDRLPKSSSNDKKVQSCGQQQNQNNAIESRKSEGGGVGLSIGGFAPRGEPSRRGRGGAHQQRGGSRVGSSHYGPPGKVPFTSGGGTGSSSSSLVNSLSQQQLDLQDKQFSPPQPGRKSDEAMNKGEIKLNSRNKNRAGKSGIDADECSETTSEASDSSDMKKSNRVRNKTDRKSRGTIGDKRGTLNSTHINGRPSREDNEGIDSGNEIKFFNDDNEHSSHTVPCEDNGFQEVKSKKMIRPTKEETKRSRSKPKEKVQGVKNQQVKGYREFVGPKGPRFLRLEQSRKQQQQQQQHQQPDVSDMNKLNQAVSSLMPVRGNESGCPPPPAHNAWIRPITQSLRTTPPLSSSITQITAAAASISQEKGSLDIADIGQSNASSQTNSPTQEKTLSKISREVEKGLLDGSTPPVNTIIFENTNYKRDSSDLNLKSNRYPIKGSRTLDKGRERKLDDDLNDNNHGMNLGSFKTSEIQPSEGKPQESIQVPMSFSKTEDSADMKLDFAFDSDLSQLSDDKTNQSAHVGQTSAADLNQKIASVKKVWDTAPGMSGHVDESHSGSSSFTQGFSNDKGLDSTGPSHHSDFNPPDSVYGSSGQLGGSAASSYVVSSGTMMKGDPVSGVNTMSKGPMFQVNAPQPQTMAAVLPSAIGSHPAPLSTPPLQGVLGFQAATYSGNLSAVPSPPNVLYNSQQATHQGDLYASYPINTAQMHSNTNRSYTDFSQSYGISQSSNFQPPSMYMPAQSGLAHNPPSVFPNHSPQYRLPPHGSNLSQQMSSNQNPVLISSTSNSIVTGSQIKTSQPAIGTKSAASAPVSNYAPSQIVVIEPGGMGFLPSSQFMAPQRPPAMQASSSFYNSPGVMGPGNQAGNIFNSSLMTGGGVSALQSAANQFGGFQGGGGNQPSTQNPSGPPNGPPPNQHPQQQYASQMGGNFRNQGYPKAGGQHHGDPAKSPSQDQFSSMFTQGGSMSKQGRVGAKPQPSPSPQPPSHKFSYSNSHVSQSNLVYHPQSGGVQSGAPNLSGSRGGAGGGMVGTGSGSVGGAGMRQGGGATGSAGAGGGATGSSGPMVVGGAATPFVNPIQRPNVATTNYSPHNYQLAPTQQAAVARQQQRQQIRPNHPQNSAVQQNKQQFYHQQGGIKVESDVSKADGGNGADDSLKGSQEKQMKDEAANVDQ